MFRRPKHRLVHTLSVAFWVWQFAVEEKANIEKCVVAALLHDVCSERGNVQFRFWDNSEYLTSEDEILLSTSSIFNMVKRCKIRHFKTQMLALALIIISIS